MTMKIKTTVILTALCAVMVLPLFAAGHRADDAFMRRGQNVDSLLLSELEEVVPERKEPGLIFNRRDKSPSAEQFIAAENAFKAGKYRKSTKLYDVLVRSYPFAPEAMRAQLGLARSLEKREKYERAFEEYCYLLRFYPENAPVEAVLSNMVAIAETSYADEKDDIAVKQLQVITSLAPGWQKAPDVYYKLGIIEFSRKNYYEAADAFDTITMSYPEHGLAASAAERHFSALYELSLKYKEDEAIQRRAFSLGVAALKVLPDREAMSVRERLNELTQRRHEKSFSTALFYDNERYSIETRIAAYEEFLREYPHASQAVQAKRRIAELKNFKTTKRGK